MRSIVYQWGFISLYLLSLSVGFFLFEPFLVFIQIFLGFFVSLLVFRRGDSFPFSVKFSSRSYWIFFSLVVFYILFRLIPFYFAHHPLGYDSGIYRFEIWSSLRLLPDFVSGLFVGLPLLTNVFGVFSVPLDFLLYGGFLFSSFLLFYFVVSFVSDRFGLAESLLVAFFITFSVVQWEAYTMLLFKQVLALSLVFFSFSLFWKRSYFIFPVLFFLFLLQPLDFLFFVLALLFVSPVLFFRCSEMKKYIFVLLGVSFSCFLFFLFLDPSYWTDLWRLFLSALFGSSDIEPSISKGVFLSLREYGYQSAFFFVFGLLGFFESFRQKKGLFLQSYFLLLFFWILFEVFFYQRLLIQLDLVLMIFSAVSFVSFYRCFVRDKISHLLFILLLFVLVIPFSFRLFSFSPIFSDKDFQQLSQFCSVLDEKVTIGVVGSFSAPWVRGACLSQNVFAPGLFANVWSYDDWLVFWEGSDPERIRILLDQYDSPLYFYEKEPNNPIFSDDTLFENVGNGWWKMAS